MNPGPSHWRLRLVLQYVWSGRTLFMLDPYPLRPCAEPAIFSRPRASPLRPSKCENETSNYTPTSTTPSYINTGVGALPSRNEGSLGTPLASDCTPPHTHNRPRIPQINTFAQRSTPATAGQNRPTHSPACSLNHLPTRRSFADSLTHYLTDSPAFCSPR